MDPLDRPFRRLLSKVPEVTVFFWIVKVLCTAVAEAVADVFGGTLTLSAVASGVLLAFALVVQFHVRRYVPGVYWAVVLLAAVTGTLIPDDLMADWDLTAGVAVAVFAVALGATFAVWYAAEKTLSIHTVDTASREAFYWLAVVIGFALGTAAGDLPALGYGAATALFAGLLVVVAVGRRSGLNPIVAFWAAFILTGPLGAHLGDLLSRPVEAGGLGLGAAVTGGASMAAIAALVGYLTRSSVDRPSLGLARPLRTRPW
jgi:uncharacterized membrane-anchored protein